MKDKIRVEPVTRLEAAERQLKVAVRLFFERKDLIAVHTLAAAAQEVVRRLAKARDFEGLYEHAQKVIRPEYQKEFVDRVRAAQNFFKHAGEKADPDERLEFFYDSTRVLLLDAVYLCLRLTGRFVPELNAFYMWTMAKYPDLLIDDGSPFIAEAKQTFQMIDCDDFEAVLYAIDVLNRQKKST